ncbi:C4-dicarboxylate ABC transporter substrate-binding protein [Hoeflea sp. BAL378]|nr:C4-dicarboxylate ABC transporter substrate-binding protein [Hoeflea sp. BAL378]
MKAVRVIERITDATAVIGVVMIVPLIGSMVYEVVSRYVFRAPTAWAYETSYMLMAAVFVFGIAYTLKVRQHVSVDIIDEFIGRKGRAVIDLLGYCLLLPCVAWISWKLCGNAVHAFQTGEVTGESSWNPVVWPHRSAIAAGFVIFTLQIVAEVIRALSYLLAAPSPAEAME